MQIQVGGKILPTSTNASVATPEDNVPVDFDGIATFLYSRPEDLAAMLAHPYYLEVVAPDEARFIDKAAPGGGMVATFVGTTVDAVDGGADAWVAGDEETRQEYRRVFQTYVS